MSYVEHELTEDEIQQLKKIENYLFVEITEDDKNLLYQLITLVNLSVSENRPLMINVNS
jgi:hypothetical protein